MFVWVMDGLLRVVTLQSPLVSPPKIKNKSIVIDSTIVGYSQHFLSPSCRSARWLSISPADRVLKPNID